MYDMDTAGGQVACYTDNNSYEVDDTQIPNVFLTAHSTKK